MTQKLDLKFFEYVICQQCVQWGPDSDKEFIASVADAYDEDYFENDDVRIVMNDIMDFYSRTTKPPNKTELRSFMSTEEKRQVYCQVLQQFKTMAMTYQLEELKANTEIFLRERAVCKALIEVTEKMGENKLDPSVILEKFTQACSISLVDNMGFSYFEDFKDHIEYLKCPTRHISTGWRWLDKQLNGGFLAEGRALYVFTGFTNVGKSIFLGNIALNVLKQNKNVLIISLEMTEQVYAHRISSQITRIPLNDLPIHLQELEDSVHAYRLANCPDAKLVIKEFPTKGMSVDHMNAYIEKLIKKGFRPDIIVVDYVNLIKTSKMQKGAGMYEEIKNITERLRASTYQFKVPLVTATQLNRSGEKKANPDMSATSESIGLSFTADAQFSIWQSDEDRAHEIINLGIQKNRYGPKSGSVSLKIDYNTLYLYEFDRVDLPADENDVHVSRAVMSASKATEESLKSFMTQLEKPISPPTEATPVSANAVMPIIIDAPAPYTPADSLPSVIAISVPVTEEKNE